MMDALTNIEANENLNSVVVRDHLAPPVVVNYRTGPPAVSGPGTHVTHDVPELSCPYQRSPGTYQPR